MKGLRMNRSLTRTFSVPSDAIRAGNFAGFAPICDPLTIDRRHRKLHAVCEQSDSGGADRPDRRRVPPARAACHVGGAVPESDVGGEVDAGHRPVQRPARSSPDERRPGVRAVQHVRRRRAPALRHQLRSKRRSCQGSAGRLAPQTRNLAVSHTHTFGSSLLNEFRFGWMNVRRRTGEPQRRRGLRGTGGPGGCDAGPARCRASRRSRRVDSTARWAIPPRSCSATTSTSSSTTISRSTAAHTASSLAATTSICGFGPSSRTTHAARSPTPGSSAATRLPISSSDIRPRRHRASAAATRTAGPIGCTCTRRTIGGCATT